MDPQQSPQPDLTGMTADELAAALVDAGEREKALAKQIADLSKQLAPLTQAREEKRAELAKLEKLRKRLRERFTEETGLDIRKSLRSPAQETMDRAVGALLAAVGEPGNLPPEDPIVIARVVAVRDALAVVRVERANAALARQKLTQPTDTPNEEHP